MSGILHSIIYVFGNNDASMMTLDRLLAEGALANDMVVSPGKAHRSLKILCTPSPCPVLLDQFIYPFKEPINHDSPTINDLNSVL